VHGLNAVNLRKLCIGALIDLDCLKLNLGNKSFQGEKIQPDIRTEFEGGANPGRA
jgi:hypothetical protein